MANQRKRKESTNPLQGTPIAIMKCPACSSMNGVVCYSDKKRYYFKCKNCMDGRILSHVMVVRLMAKAIMMYEIELLSITPEQLENEHRYVEFCAQNAPTRFHTAPCSKVMYLQNLKNKGIQLDEY